MRLVLLPGLDGTGRLFESILAELDPRIVTSVVELPQRGEQGYDFLAEHVRQNLPGERFVLLAESFSGPIAYRLLQEPANDIISVIFVASFIRRPSSFVKAVSLFVPEIVFRRSPLANPAVKFFLTGFGCDPELIGSFRGALEEAGTGVIKARLRAVACLPEPEARVSTACFYILASNDRLVGGRNFSEFEKCFENIKLYRIDGPHLILQTRAKECAAVVNEILTS